MTLKYLITGGSGFIGTNIVELLLQKNYSVLNLDLNEPVKPDHLPYWRKCNILDFNNLSREVSFYSPDVILHFAARTDLAGSSLEAYAANTVGVENLVRVCNENICVKYSMFASSMLVCAIDYSPANNQDYAPSTFYGMSKVSGEKIVLEKLRGDLHFNIVRPTSVWGPWFKAPYINFFEFVMSGLYFHPINSTVRRNYSYVENFAFQVLELSTRFGEISVPKITYLADYEPIEIGKWADLIKAKYSKKIVYRLPLTVFKILAIFGDLLKYLGYKDPPMSSFRLKNMLSEKIFNMEQLKESIGPLPFDTEAGVDRTLNWLKKQKD